MSGGVVSLAGYQLHDLTWKRQDPALKARLDALKQGIVSDPRFGDVYDKRVAVRRPGYRGDLDRTGAGTRDTGIPASATWSPTP